MDDVVVAVTTYTCSAQLTTPGEASDPAGPGAPFMIGKDGGSGYMLSWSAPPGGGPSSGYELYHSPLGATWTPTCAADLGSGTSAVLPALSDDMAYVVVARNGAGEGSYGEDTSGAPRPAAQGGGLCP